MAKKLDENLIDYIHLQKTKVGVDSALRRKGVDVAADCRKILANKIRWNGRTVLMAEIILEQLNVR